MNCLYLTGFIAALANFRGIFIHLNLNFREIFESHKNKLLYFCSFFAVNLKTRQALKSV